MEESWLYLEFWPLMAVLFRFAVQLLAAFVGTVAFSVLFSVPPRHYIPCGLTGSVGWAVYLYVNSFHHTPVLATFAASIVLTMVARILASACRASTTVFLVCGIFTLVPGAGIYYTAYNIFVGDGHLALAYGVDSLKLALAIGLGIGVAYSIPASVFGWSRESGIWNHEEK